MLYGDIEVFVKDSGGDGKPVALLHGWGASSDAMGGIFNSLSRSGRRVCALDFPGFGKSGYPPESWGIYEYADCVQYVLSNLGFDKPAVVGHSFGGRVALILASRGVASRIVLTDAAGLKPKYSLRKAIAVRRYKAKKRKGKDVSEMGSADYAALPPEMRKVFVRVVNTHLDSLLPLIDVPTLLFWGRDDKDTPPYMARKFHRRIADSGLIMLKGAGHFAYAERADVFNAAVRVFTE